MFKLPARKHMVSFRKIVQERQLILRLLSKNIKNRNILDNVQNFVQKVLKRFEKVRFLIIVN